MCVTVTPSVFIAAWIGSLPKIGRRQAATAVTAFYLFALCE